MVLKFSDVAPFDFSKYTSKKFNILEELEIEFQYLRLLIQQELMD